MSKFTLFTSVITIAAVAGFTSAAAADCAADLAALKSQMGVTASTTGGSGGNSMQPAQQGATGEVSGVEATNEMAKAQPGSPGVSGSGATQETESGQAAPTTAGAGAVMPTTAATTSAMGGSQPADAASGPSQMAMTHIQEARAALGKGDETACTAALRNARSAM